VAENAEQNDRVDTTTEHVTGGYCAV